MAYDHKSPANNDSPNVLYWKYAFNLYSCALSRGMPNSVPKPKLGHSESDLLRMALLYISYIH